MKTLYDSILGDYKVSESLLGDIDDTIERSDKYIENTKTIHWKYSVGPIYTHRNVKGGIRAVIKKHFPSKLTPITINDPNAALKDDSIVNKTYTGKYFDVYYFISMILSTKLPKHINDYHFNLWNDKKEVEKYLDDNINSYMTKEWQDYRTSENNFPVFSTRILTSFKGKYYDSIYDSILIKIYYHQDDVKYESVELCDIMFKTIKNKKLYQKLYENV